MGFVDCHWGPGRRITSGGRRMPIQQRKAILCGILVAGLLGCAIFAGSLILQLWLLTATMHAWMGADDSIVWPAALASLVCFLVNLLLLRRVFYLQDTGS